MAKIILGFTGLMCCGKGTINVYLSSHYGAATYRYSTMIRDVLDRLYLPHSRDNMSHLSTLLRQEFGEDLMAKVMARDVTKAAESLIAIDGIRRPMDVSSLRELPEFKLVAINAAEEVRYQRLINRGENPDDKTKTREQFRADHLLETEASIPGAMAEADFQLDNNGALEQLYQQLDDLLKKLGYEGKI
ncbi:MAG: AAA family ATPase [Candidatus Komeilibacteria bacterium]